MRMRVLAFAAATSILSPMAASAQSHGGGYEERGRDVHVDRYHNGDHDDVIVPRPLPYYEKRPAYFESRRHNHHRDY